MSKPITISYTFSTQAGPIPLSQLDANFSTAVGAINDLSTYSNYFVDSSGAANTLTVTTTGLTFSYVAGIRLDVKLANTNTSPTVNINVNALGNQQVLNADGTTPAIGQLVAGQILPLQYNGTAFVLQGPQSKPGSIAPFTATAAGNVTLPAPSSGVALNVIPFSGQSALNVTAASGTIAQIQVNSTGFAESSFAVSNISEGISAQFAYNGTSTTDVYGFASGAAGVGIYQTGFPLVFTTSATERMRIASAGNVTINSPSSGFSLNVSGATESGDFTATGSRSAFLNGAITTNSQVVLANSVTSFGLNMSWDGSNWRTGTDGGSDGGALILSGYNPGNLAFYTVPNAGGSNQTISSATLNSTYLRMVIGSAGNVTVYPPSSGTALTISGPSPTTSTPQLSITGTGGGSALVNLIDGQTGNRNWAIASGLISAGLFSIYDVSGTAGRFTIDTSGNVNITSPSGSLAPIYVGVPQNIQNNNYTLVLSDANKQILHNIGTAHTYTFPANSSVSYPIGTLITIVNGGLAGGTLTVAINSDTFQFFPSGATGSRTMAPYSQATFNKVTSTVWVVTGVGIT